MKIPTPITKPENVKTELGAIAACIGGMVAFLAVAATNRASFDYFEWWAFVGIGIIWFFMFAKYLLTMHKDRFILEEQGKTIDRYSKLTDTQIKAIEAQGNLLKTYSALQGGSPEQLAHVEGNNTGNKADQSDSSHNV